MRRLFKVSVASTGINTALLIARIAIGVLMLTHGLPKMENLFSGEPVQFASVMGMSPVLTLWLAVFAEVFCSILLIVGFATRMAVIPLIITMFIAVFMIHANDPFAKQEMGLHYLVTYVVLFFTGSGKYSIDAILTDRKQQNAFSVAQLKEQPYRISNRD